MDFQVQMQELLETQITNAINKAEANSKPQLQELLARVRAAKDAEEVRRLMPEFTALIEKSGGGKGSTMRQRWNAIKALFGR
jgi:hypothetical protein